MGHAAGIGAIIVASLEKSRRVRLILFSGVALVSATALIGYAMRDGIQFFRTPTEVATDPPAANEGLRIGGMVEHGSLVRDGANFSFRVTDGETSFPISYVGIVPDLFREGEGTIATGSVIGGVFRATEILAKHDEVYMPSELAEMEALRD